MAVLALAISLNSSVNNALADDGDSDKPRFVPTDLERAIRSGYVPMSARGSKVVQVILKIDGDPVAIEQARSGRRLSANQKDAIKQKLSARQDAMRPDVERRGGTIQAKYQVAYNGLRVAIAADKVAGLAAIPGVISVTPVERMERTNSLSVPFIGAPAVWNGVDGFRGENVKIAVIDTGIDYTHANFGGPGTVAAYQAAHAAEASPANPTVFGPSAPKVKGGIDLAGDAYNGDNTPRPDANPLDCNGHGSHVAGTAAGFGVRSTGATYSGPYDNTTHSTAFRVGPGVAPKADLYAVRVFGCEGSTNLTVDAIEWAVDNDMQVINMSLGSSFVGNDSPSAEASNNAALAGVIVVASAGNAGPAQYITGSPGTGTRVISVAAMDTVAPETFPNTTLTLNGTLGTVIAQSSNGVTIPNGLTWQVHVLRNADGTVSLGCNESEYVDALITGKLVVTQRGVCARVARAVFGQKHHAAAVAMINSSTDMPPYEGEITGNPDTGEALVVTIPFLGLKGLASTATSDGGKLAAATTATTGPAAPTPNTGYRAPSSFTSGGPRIGDSALKPDVAAPGTNIISTGVGSGNGPATFSGTSMAAPHVAGVAALMRQARPGWNVEDVKAAIVNTGSSTQFVNGYRVSRAGSGVVQPASATKTSSTAIGDAGTASLSFGFIETAVNYTATKTITVRNFGSSAVTFEPTFVSNSPFSRPHTVAFGAASVTVPAGGSSTLAATLRINVGDIFSAGAYREASGNITLTPQGGGNSGIALRVPYLLVPRALSKLSTNVAGKLNAGQSSAATTTNVGGGRPGNADYYAWGLVDGNQGLGSNDIRAVGVQSFDISPTLPSTDRLLVFAVNNWGRWNNAATSEYDLTIEAGADGKAKYIVFAADQGLVTTGLFNGVMATFVFNTSTRALTPSPFAPTATTDNSTLLMLVPGSQIGLSAANPEFRYSAASFEFRGIGDNVVPGKATYNAWNGGLTQGQFYSVAPNASVTTTINATREAGGVGPNLGVMIVTIDNAAGAGEAQLIEIPR